MHFTDVVPATCANESPSSSGPHTHRVCVSTDARRDSRSTRRSDCSTMMAIFPPFQHPPEIAQVRAHPRDFPSGVGQLDEHHRGALTHPNRRRRDARRQATSCDPTRACGKQAKEPGSNDTFLRTPWTDKHARGRTPRSGTPLPEPFSRQNHHVRLVGFWVHHTKRTIFRKTRRFYLARWVSITKHHSGALLARRSPPTPQALLDRIC